MLKPRHRERERERSILIDDCLLFKIASCFSGLASHCRLRCFSATPKITTNVTSTPPKNVKSKKGRCLLSSRPLNDHKQWVGFHTRFVILFNPIVGPGKSHKFLLQFFLRYRILLSFPLCLWVCCFQKIRCQTGFCFLWHFHVVLLRFLIWVSLKIGSLILCRCVLLLTCL